MTDSSEARERVLQAAAALFRDRGYLSVTMNDIAAVLNVRKASLYYHAPQGKDQLYTEVMLRMLAEIGAGVRAALAKAEPDLRSQLLAIGLFHVTHPPFDTSRLFRTDIRALPPEFAHDVLMAGNAAIFEPVTTLIEQAQARGEIRAVDAHMVAVTFIVSVQSLHEESEYKHKPIEGLADQLVRLYMDGLRP